MDLVKAAPLLGGERPQDWVAKHARLRTEPLLGVGEGRVHGDQGIVEDANRFVAHSGFWPGLLGRFNSPRKPTDDEHIKAPQMLARSRA